LSWISHTLVTGGSVAPVAPVDPVGAGAGALGEVVLGAEEVFDELFVEELLVVGGAVWVVAAGVSCGLTGGGCTAAVLACLLASVLTFAASEAISAGSCWLAREAGGAGAIAAPTATPMPSIAAARTALARIEGRRRTGARDGAGAGIGAGGASALEGFSGVSVIVGTEVQSVTKLRVAGPESLSSEQRSECGLLGLGAFMRKGSA
jgi:hypothetical protein